MRIIRLPVRYGTAYTMARAAARPSHRILKIQQEDTHMPIRMKPISPTSLQKFLQCPKQFHAMYIERSLPRPSSPAMQRGERIHKFMELAVSKGWQEAERDVSMQDDQHLLPRMRGAVEAIERLRRAGWTVTTEQELATDGNGGMRGWWDNDVYLRCKVDVLAVSPGKDRCMVFDWKTGRSEVDATQLHINSMLVRAMTGISSHVLLYVYLDLDVIKNFSLVMPVSKPRLAVTEAPAVGGFGVVLPTLVALCEYEVAHEKGEFPAKKNQYCRFCEVPTCEERR